MPPYRLKSWIPLDKLYWRNLSANPAAIELLRENRHKIDWRSLSANKNPAAIELLRENRDKIDWIILSGNPAAIDLLRENHENIDWIELSLNPAAIELLRANQDKIDWAFLSDNPSIFDDLGKSAGKIQRGFRGSRGYAKWAYSPERLASQGYFENNMDFGKRRSTKSTKRRSNTNSGMSLKTIDRLIKLVQKM